jgi:hypothetical protein
MKIGSKNRMVRSHRLLSLVLVAIGFLKKADLQKLTVV